jgi:predicted enzyme related to lactoylglutathione lyase
MVDDMEDTLKGLAKKGVLPCRGPLEIKPGLIAAFIQDPDGVEVELMQETG